MSEGIIIALISAGSAIVIAIISAIANSKSKKSKAEKTIGKKIKNIEEELKKITEKIEELEHLKQQKLDARKMRIDRKNQASNEKHKVMGDVRFSLSEPPEEIELNKLIDKRNELENQLKMLRESQESSSGDCVG